jgi:hypothetical protein
VAADGTQAYRYGRRCASTSPSLGAMIEKRLGVSDHFAGRSLTAADIIRLFPLTNMRVLMACDPAASAGRRQGLLAVGRPLSRGRLGMRI